MNDEKTGIQSIDYMEALERYRGNKMVYGLYDDGVVEIEEEQFIHDHYENGGDFGFPCDYPNHSAEEVIFEKMMKLQPQLDEEIESIFFAKRY